MAGETTLIVTTRSGVRPLGVRGEPLHAAAPQLRRVVRRRLGDAAAGLLAEPQVHEDGKAIDWYADWAGVVQPLSALAPERQAEVVASVEGTLAEIRRLGDTLAGAGPREDMGVVGLSLQLAARAPAQSFIFMVADRPTIVCWGYEKEAAASLLPATLPRASDPLPGAAAPPFRRRSTVPCSRHRSVCCRSCGLPPRPSPGCAPLLLALPLLLLLMGAAWLLRERLPADPALSLATREGPPAPPPAEAPPDPSPLLKAAYATEQSRGRVLQTELSLIEAELKRRIAACKPPEPPKPVEPPQAAAGCRRATARQAGADTRRPPPRRRGRPGPTTTACACRRRRPTTIPSCRAAGAPIRSATSCRRARPASRPTASMPAATAQLEWRRGRTACRTRAQSRFDGGTLRLRDGDTTCNDGSHWYADQLVCRPAAPMMWRNVAAHRAAPTVRSLGRSTCTS